MQLRESSCWSSTNTCHIGGICEPNKNGDHCSQIVVEFPLTQITVARQGGLQPTESFGFGRDDLAEVRVCPKALDKPGFQENLKTLLRSIDPSVYIDDLDELRALKEVRDVFEGEIGDPASIITEQGLQALEKVTSSDAESYPQGYRLSDIEGTLTIIPTYNLE